MNPGSLVQTAEHSSSIDPLIGKLKVTEVTTWVMERYYQQLLKTETVIPMIGKRRNKYVTPQTIRAIHKLLHSCFEQAIKWEIILDHPSSQNVGGDPPRF